MHNAEVWKRVPTYIRYNVEMYVMTCLGDPRISNVPGLFVDAFPPMENRFSRIPKDGLAKSLKEFELDFSRNKMKELTIRTLFEIRTLLKILQSQDLKAVYDRYHSYGFGGLLASKIKQVPYAVEFNGYPGREGVENTGLGKLIRGPREILLRMTLRCSNMILPVSVSIGRALSIDYSVSISKFKVIPNGADVELFKPKNKAACRKRIGLPLNAHILCFVGTYNTYQGLERLIEGFIELRNMYSNDEVRPLLLLVGLGIKEIVEKVDPSGLNNGSIKSFGMVPYEDVPFILGASDICIATFVEERIASPIKIYEYMAAGKPLAITHIPDTEFIEEKCVGVRLPNDAAGIANTLRTLLFSRDDIIKMGKNARKVALTQYNWDIISKDVALAIININKTHLK